MASIYSPANNQSAGHPANTNTNTNTNTGTKSIGSKRPHGLDGPELDGKGAIKTGDNRAPSPGSSKSTGNKKTKQSTQTKQKVDCVISRTEDIEIKREVAAAFCSLSSVQDNKVEIADCAISTIITLLLSGDAEVGSMTELDFWKRRQQKLLSIIEQLKTKECRSILAMIADTVKSANPELTAAGDAITLLHRWKQIDINLTEAANETKDNVKYLFTVSLI
jgi:hypothetical protein